MSRVLGSLSSQAISSADPSSQKEAAMCGRFTLKTAPEVLRQQFGIEDFPLFAPRFNIAPTQPVATLRQIAKCARRELSFLRWGLIPSWATDSSIGNRLLNARADTLADKPSFRSAFGSRRCLVLADGFFEWQTHEGKKQPIYFRCGDGEAFGIAGLWERWSRGEQTVESCTLITTEANELVRTTHDRMPAILSRDDFEAWLDPTFRNPRKLSLLLRPHPPERMTAWPVNNRVNSPRHDEPNCIEPVSMPPIVVQRNLFELA